MQLVTVHAAVDTTQASEHAGVHVGHAGRADDRHRSTTHVDFSADVHDRVRWCKCGLTPGVKDLSVDEGGLGVNGSPRTGPADRERNGLGLVLRDRDGQLWCHGIDP